jgi:SAM-dependent methyltransferase
MTLDTRSDAAKYYDYQDFPWDDISFYEGFLKPPHGKSSQQVLELGCGTGRVLAPLAKYAGFIRGIDCSEAMIAICKRKLKKNNIPANKAAVTVADITSFHLEMSFDFIIAPFRVIQNIEEPSAVIGLFDCIREHMKPEGSCILNVFKPYLEAERLKKEWCFEGERFYWEKTVEGKRIALFVRQPAMNKETMVLYPELIYRTYSGDRLEDEAVHKFPMKCYYPDEFEDLVKGQGFKILNKWGGYQGEAYGEGPELVIRFTHGKLIQ